MRGYVVQYKIDEKVSFVGLLPYDEFSTRVFAVEFYIIFFLLLLTDRVRPVRRMVCSYMIFYGSVMRTLTADDLPRLSPGRIRLFFSVARAVFCCA